MFNDCLDIRQYNCSKIGSHTMQRLHCARSQISQMSLQTIFLLSESLLQMLLQCLTILITFCRVKLFLWLVVIYFYKQPFLYIAVKFITLAKDKLYKCNFTISYLLKIYICLLCLCNNWHIPLH